MDPRLNDLHHWLKTTCGLENFILQPLQGDASFRRYFRVQHAGPSYVAMDAPPERENCLPFVAIARALRQHGLITPDILAQDITQGFLLLTDFGDRVFLKELNSSNAFTLYSSALDSLASLQRCRQVEGWTLPSFNQDFIFQELQLFKHWFLQTHLKLTCAPPTEKMLTNFFNFLAESAAAQPQVFMHRDYHSGNLMLLPESQVGILDFQDAFIGPVTYDAVSLLRDCYVFFPTDLVTRLVLEYRQRLPEVTLSRDEFLYRFDLMGLQRHLKALLTFVRKYHRDGNRHYLQYILPTLNYVNCVSEQYAVCKEFHEFLLTVIFPAQEGV